MFQVRNPNDRKFAKDRKIWTYEFKALAPILGGGFLSKDPDEDEPIRTTAVRAGIRWWWRQLMLAKVFSVPELKPGQHVPAVRKLESEVWGFTSDKGQPDSGPGKVEISFELGRSTFRRLPVDQMDGAKQLSYAFAMMLGGNDPIPDVLQGDLSATIHVAGANTLVLDAIELWLAFGSIGGRGRRGFGAVSGGVRLHDIKEIFKSIRGSTPPAGWKGSTLAGSELYLKPNQTALGAWQAAMSPYQSFRKGVKPGRTLTDTKTRWPEADSLRSAQNQDKPVANWFPEGPGNLVPRADLGLPIRFSNKDGEVGGAHMNADDNTFSNDILQLGENGERWPSPVITKACVLDCDFYSAVLILKSPGPPKGLIQWNDTRSREAFVTDCSTWPAPSTEHDSVAGNQFNAVLASDAFRKYCNQNLRDWEPFSRELPGGTT